MQGARAITGLLALIAVQVCSLAGCGGGDSDRPRYGSLGTTALCNDNSFSFETDCSQICSASGVKQWYVNCGQEGTGPTSPMPGSSLPWPPIEPPPAGGYN